MVSKQLILGGIFQSIALSYSGAFRDVDWQKYFPVICPINTSCGVSLPQLARGEGMAKFSVEDAPAKIINYGRLGSSKRLVITSRTANTLAGGKGENPVVYENLKRLHTNPFRAAVDGVGLRDHGNQFESHLQLLRRFEANHLKNLKEFAEVKSAFILAFSVLGYSWLLQKEIYEFAMHLNARLHAKDPLINSLTPLPFDWVGLPLDSSIRPGLVILVDSPYKAVLVTFEENVAVRFKFNLKKAYDVFEHEDGEFFGYCYEVDFPSYGLNVMPPESVISIDKFMHLDRSDQIEYILEKRTPIANHLLDNHRFIKDCQTLTTEDEKEFLPYDNMKKARANFKLRQTE